MNFSDNNGYTGFHCACSFGKFDVIKFLVQHGFEGINEININGKTGLEMLIADTYEYGDIDNEIFIACVLLLIEAGAELNKNDIFDELIFAIKNRIIEITFMKEKIFEKWTGRIAQAITDFAIDSFTNTGLQNLCQYLD